MNEQQVTIIAGAARGIGLGIAKAMAERGDQLVLADVLFARDSARAEALAQLSGAPFAKATDITDSRQVEALIAETSERFGRIDCLVNAAGMNRPGLFYEISEADWDATINLNMKGAFLLSRAVAGPMIARHFGRIVHIGSTAAHTAALGLAPYVASKHGLVGLVKGMACDLARHGITVNAVCPGNTDTEMLAAVIEARARLQGRAPDEVRADIVAKTPVGRLARPDDIAAAVLFMTSRAAECVTGQALTVDGGRMLNLM